MQEARKLGSYIDYLAKREGLTASDLSGILHCGEDQVFRLLKGRAVASFSQISSLASALNCTVVDLMKGDEESYNATVVHCMNGFRSANNREFILDLIDDYVDVVDAVSKKQ